MNKHCDLCANKHTMNCPHHSDCYDNVERPFFKDKYIYTNISFIEKFKLLFKKKYCSINTTKYFVSKLYYKILNDKIYIIKEVLEKKEIRMGGIRWIYG